MGQVVNSSTHIKNVKQHLQQYSFDTQLVEHLRYKERRSEMTDLSIVYDMLHSFKKSVSNELRKLELHLEKIENQRLNSFSATSEQQHRQTDTESLLEKLSCRELEVLNMFVKGYSYNESAEILGCKIATIQTYTKRIYKKLKVHSRSEAIFEARQLGIIHL